MNKNGSKSLKIIQNYQKWREPSHRNDANGPKSNIKMSENGSKSHKMNGIIKIERTQLPKWCKWTKINYKMKNRSK